MFTIRHFSIALIILAILASCQSLASQAQRETLTAISKTTVATHPLAREHRYDDAMANEIATFWKQGQSKIFIGEDNFHLASYAITSSSNQNAIVILHGKSETQIKYRELAYDLFHLGYDIYLYDQRGHGLSQHHTDDPEMLHEIDFMNYVRDLKTFIDAIVKPNSNKPLFLFAHSMGGGISLRFLAEYPDVFEVAILSAPMLAINMGPIPEWLALSITWASSLVGLGANYAPGQAAMIPGKLGFKMAATSSKIRYEYYNKEIFKHYQDGLFNYTGGVSNGWLKEAIDFTRETRSESVASQIKTPILIFQAENDWLVKDSGQNAICGWAANCTIVEVSNAKHEIWHERDEIRIPFLERIAHYLCQFPDNG